MPKKVEELSSAEVRRKKKPGLHAVGGVAGLQLQVTPTGARSWILRTMVGKKRRDIGLGGFPDVGLAQARDKAREIKECIKQGIDPIAARKAARDALAAAHAKRVTFDQAAAQFLANKQHEFKNAKHAAQWESTLNTYASPIIGKLPVDQVDLAHIVKILEPIWLTKTETATRVRGRIESVLAFSTVRKYRGGDNPARWRGNLDAVLAKPRKVAKVKHHAALPYTELPGFVVELRKRDGIATRALEFAILTAARSGEVRGATWDEINFTTNTWTVPAERMKAGKEHTIPLSPAAIKLLKELPRLNNYVFPAPRGGELSDMALSAVTRRMKVDAVPHGFRSTFRDWCAERTNYPNEVAEMALAHSISNAVEKAYRRGDLFLKRTHLMADWCKFINTPTKAGKVLPIRV